MKPKKHELILNDIAGTPYGKAELRFFANIRAFSQLVARLCNPQ